MGATSPADSKETTITVAAVAAVLTITVIGLALGLWRWREAVEKRKLEAAAENGTPWQIENEQNGFVFSKLQQLRDPSYFDLESQSTDPLSIPLVDLRLPVPALVRTPATGDIES